MLNPLFPRRTVRAVACLVVCATAALVPAVGCKPPQPAAPTPPPPLVTVARPVLHPVQNYKDYNGYLEAVETVEIRARVKGYLETVFFKEGDEVKVGDRLYQIDPREYKSAVAKVEAEIAQANANIDSARVKVEETNTEWLRLKDLQGASDKEKTAAKSAWDVAKAQLKLAEANLQAANASLRTANIQLGYTDIKSPIAGRISRTLVTPGNLVGQTDSTLLTTIVSTDPIYVYFDAPERDLVEYERGVGAVGGAKPVGTQPLLVGVATETGYPHAGEIDFRENRVDSGTGTVRLRGQLKNPKGEGGKQVLVPGLFARVQVPLGDKIDRPVIPEEALMTGQEGRFVYVLGEENKVTKRTVKVGATVWRAPPPDDTKTSRWQLLADKPDKDGKPVPSGVVRSVVAIEGGLSEKDVVIVNGLQKARPGTPVTPDERRFTPPR